LDVAIAVASALAAVHRSNLVHRDVKPQNVVESEGVYKLIDFGIAAGDAPGAASRAPSPRPVVSPDAATGKTEHASMSNNPYILAGTLGYMDPISFRDQVPA